MAYLDRHDVDCGIDSVISKFVLTRPAVNRIKYDYTCLKSATPLTCRTVTTPLADRGYNGGVEYLDKHLLSCNNDESISRFKYISSGNNMAYEYKCCK